MPRQKKNEKRKKIQLHEKMSNTSTKCVLFTFGELGIQCMRNYLTNTE